MSNVEAGITQIPGQEFIDEALGKFESVWQEYRQDGTGKALTETEATRLYTLARSRAVLDVALAVTGSRDHSIPETEYLKALGINFDADRRQLLDDKGIGLHKKIGLLSRATHLSNKILRMMPQVEEIQTKRINEWVTSYLGLY